MSPPEAVIAVDPPHADITVRRHKSSACLLARVAGPSRGTARPETDFKYVGPSEQSGWMPGHVPLFLQWFPEQLDPRSMVKFLENGREYVVGRAPTSDFFLQNLAADSGISGQHLKIKVSPDKSRC
jgi:hypothetical protein